MIQSCTFEKLQIILCILNFKISFNGGWGVGVAGCGATPVVVVVVCIFRYFHLYLQKSIKKIKKREEAEPQGQALAKRTCRGGVGETNKQINNVIGKERRAMQAEI